jgi:peptide/nickel transport system substrate-binding protein
MSFIAWNTARAPLDDRSVRRALTTGIDRTELIQTVWGGYAQECTSPIVPLLWAFDPSIPALPFDPAAARAQLAALGFKDSDGDGIVERDGKPFELELVVNDAQNRVDVVTIVQAQLKRIGVGVRLRVLEFGTYQERVLAADFDGAFVEWKVQTKVDLTSLFHSASRRPHGFNFGAYANPEVDRLIQEALATSDHEAARQKWNRIQKLIYDDQPYTFIAVPQELTAIDDRFCNVKPSAISFFVNLPAWRLVPECGP